jgi:hypothetical protein
MPGRIIRPRGRARPWPKHAGENQKPCSEPNPTKHGRLSSYVWQSSVGCSIVADPAVRLVRCAKALADALRKGEGDNDLHITLLLSSCRTSFQLVQGQCEKLPYNALMGSISRRGVDCQDGAGHPFGGLFTPSGGPGCPQARRGCGQVGQMGSHCLWVSGRPGEVEYSP